MICLKNYPPEVDKFEKADLKLRHSKKIQAPGIEAVWHGLNIHW